MPEAIVSVINWPAGSTNGQALFEKIGQVFEVEDGGGVGRGFFGSGMDFDEQAISAGGGGGRASKGTNWRWPAVAWPRPPGSWVEWVASMRTGVPPCECGG